MSDIIIYTKKEKIKHKKNLRNICSFWTLANLPKKFIQGKDKIYFAYDGYIQGYFNSEWHGSITKKLPEKCVSFHPRWYPLEKKIPIKHFQG